MSFCGFAAARCSSCAATSTVAGGGRAGGTDGAGRGSADGAGVRCGVGAGAAAAVPTPSFARMELSSDIVLSLIEIGGFVGGACARSGLNLAPAGQVPHGGSHLDAPSATLPPSSRNTSEAHAFGVGDCIALCCCVCVFAVSMLYPFFSKPLHLPRSIRRFRSRCPISRHSTWRRARRSSLRTCSRSLK